MSEREVEIAVIGLLPADLRRALGERFVVADYPLEGPSPVPMEGIPAGTQVVATRALLGVPPRLPDALRKLRLVLSMGAGLERIDLNTLKERGVEVVHTPDAFTEDVADFAIGQIFAAQRDLLAADAFVRSGDWKCGRFRTARRVTNRKVGIVGMGRIGRRIAAKCTALGMSARYTSHSPREKAGVEYCSDVCELAAWCDILVLACPDTPQTRNLIGAAALSALGSEGILINVARGTVIDDDALIDALRSGTIKAAALDVFRSEPEIDPRFLELENVLLSPHSASFTLEARQAVNDRLLSAAAQFFKRRALSPSTHKNIIT